MKKRICFLQLVILMLSASFLVACGTTEVTQEDALSELEAIADANGDIDLVMKVNFSSNLKSALNYQEIEWTVISATTPKGRELKGIAVFEPNDANLTLNFEELRFKGKITTVQGQKAMLGAFSSNLTAQTDGLVGTFLLTKSGSNFGNNSEAENLTLLDQITLRNYEEVKVTFLPQELDKSSVLLAVGKLAKGGVFLGYVGAISGQETTACTQANGTLSFTGQSEKSSFGALLKGEGMVCDNALSKGIIGILIGWKVEEGEG